MKFGGGGHAMASGARIKGDFTQVQEMVLNAICDDLHKD